MALITDNQLSGILPDVKTFSVHYPGYPSSSSRAIETLGGIEGLLKSRSSDSNHLELRFRPEDPFSHPVFGELHQSCGLLLKISKQRFNIENAENNGTHLYPETNNVDSMPNSSGTVHEVPQTVSQTDLSTVGEGYSVKSGDESSPGKLYTAIVARIPQAYFFKGMLDYQHVLPVHADVARSKKRQWTEVETHFAKGGLMDLDQEELMFLIPHLFTSKEIPENLLLNSSVSLNSRLKQQGVTRQYWEMNIDPCLAIDFKIEEVPKKINWEDNIPQGSAQWERMLAISKLFDERPIWPKYSIKERLIDGGLVVSNDQLKRLLFRTGYYFSTGPFGRFWIRKGYDPRKDPESRIYQRVDFRLPSSLRNSGHDEESNHTWKDICRFRVFPSKSFLSLQLFELDDEYIQEEIRKPLDRPLFERASGWFSRGVFQALMLRVRVRLLSIFPRNGAQDSLKSATARFEKCKKWKHVVRDVTSDDKQNEHVGADSNGNISEELQATHNAMETIGDGEDDSENEDYEEEVDDYADAGDDLSLQPCSYPAGELFSQDYLQQLFASFPQPEVDNNTFQDADDASDGEYQIFEQDGDDYSDDDI